MQEIKGFRQCIEDSELEELKSSGALYAWCNKQSGDNRVYSRIDRVITKMDWVTQLLDSTVHYMNVGMFDHSLRHNKLKGGGNHTTMFRYFNMA